MATTKRQRQKAARRNKIERENKEAKRRQMLRRYYHAVLGCHRRHGGGLRSKAGKAKDRDRECPTNVQPVRHEKISGWLIGGSAPAMLIQLYQAPRSMGKGLICP